uniref:Uncharacterized protein n=1 Tax=Arundo donax TaxID=35708 RepID=A0A0A9GWD4_ARUDO
MLIYDTVSYLITSPHLLMRMLSVRQTMRYCQVKVSKK